MCAPNTTAVSPWPTSSCATRPNRLVAIVAANVSTARGRRRSAAACPRAWHGAWLLCSPRHARLLTILVAAVTLAVATSAAARPRHHRAPRPGHAQGPHRQRPAGRDGLCRQQEARSAATPRSTSTCRSARTRSSSSSTATSTRSRPSRSRTRGAGRRGGARPSTSRWRPRSARSGCTACPTAPRQGRRHRGVDDGRQGRRPARRPRAGRQRARRRTASSTSGSRSRPATRRR